MREEQIFAQCRREKGNIMGGGDFGPICKPLGLGTFLVNIRFVLSPNAKKCELFTEHCRTRTSTSSGETSSSSGPVR
jgi:hypothetical protein